MTTTKKITINADVVEILKRATFTAKGIAITEQLDRKMYVKVNKVIESAGGKWDRKQQCHVFHQNPKEVFNIESGEVMPDNISGDAIEQMAKNGKQVVSAPQLFPTPPDLAQRMVELADIKPGMSVLEPSAGTGNILKAIGDDSEVTAVEINSRLCELLRETFRFKELVNADFLTCNGNLGTFDRVIMNPPFEKAQDIAHILNAAKYLKPSGRLVAICAGGPRQEAALKPLSTTWERLPEGSFKNSGTNVNTILLTIER